MRQIQMYSVFDKKSDRWDTPFFAYDDIAAKRHFIMMVRKEGSMINNFASEFDLYHVCSYDVETGEVENVHPRLAILLSGNEVFNNESKK
jgi:hypothetical protein